MCGIAGGTGRLTPPEIDAVKAALRHRGPDDAGATQKNGVWLLNTRLAIQDRSLAGRQPMHSPDGRYTLVYNGEIYNHPELRASLPGVAFEGRSDTETLLQCWMHRGSACLNDLNGDFAFAIYDDARRELFLARDRMGVKPLYYYVNGRDFAFASELKALLELKGIDRSLDHPVFANYLLYQYNPDARTPFRQIKKLLPGHAMRIRLDESQPEIFRYYRLPFSGRQLQKTPRAWQDETQATLEQSVARQMVGDAPLALTLSGGLDSALVAAFARKANPGSPLDAYCIDTGSDMSAEGFADDAAYAKLAAKGLNLRLQLIPGNYDLAAEIDPMVLALDEPQADPAAINMRLIARAARADGNSVILTGAGADDLFSGYRRHQLLRFHRMLRFAPGPVRRLGPLLARFATGRPALRRMEKALRTAGRDPLEAAIHSFFWNEPQTIASLFAAPVQSLQRPYELFHQLLREIPEESSLLNQVLFLEQRSFLPHHNLAYVDKLTMAEGVEARTPFLDRDLVSLAAAMPPELKLRGVETKHVLRNVARGLIPDAIIDRPKTGFAFPLRSWIRGAGRACIRERLLDPSFLSQGMFDGAAVSRFVDASLSGRCDGAYTLFSLLCIESWLRQFKARP